MLHLSHPDNLNFERDKEIFLSWFLGRAISKVPFSIAGRFTGLSWVSNAEVLVTFRSLKAAAFWPLNERPQLVCFPKGSLVS